MAEFSGCSGWDGLCLHLGRTFAEPEGLVAVEASLDHRGLPEATLVCLSSGSCAISNYTTDGTQECTYEPWSQESVAEFLVRWAHVSPAVDGPPGSVWVSGLSPFRGVLLAHAAMEAAREGSHICWSVMCTSGDVESHSRDVAIYDDPQMAVEHARAAALHQDAQEPDEDGCDPSYWSVEPRLRRRRLPEVLLPFANGEQVPPLRPVRLRGEHGAYGRDYMVKVPDRGEVAFAGSGSEAASGAFLCGLPSAKPFSEDRSDSRSLVSLISVARKPQSHEVTWGHRPWYSTEILEGHAAASGPDAAGLADDTARILQGAVDRAAAQTAERAATNESETETDEDLR